MRKRILTFFFVLVMIFVQLPSAAHAETTELLTQYLVDGQPMPGVSFSVYHIASVDKDNYKHFYLDEEFSKYHLDLEIYGDIEKVINLGKLLESYISSDNLQPVETLRTDENGMIRFTGLTYGIYLLTGEKTSASEGMSRKPVPVLFALPYYSEDGKINTSVFAKVKHELSKDPITQRVLISWREDQYVGTDNRPAFVTIQLLRDGVVYDEVSVSAEMGWTYTWENLDPAYTWTMIQKGVPPVYQTSASQTGITYVFTNKAEGSPAPVDPTPDDPTPDTPEKPNGSYVKPQGPYNPSTGTDRPTVNPGGGNGVVNDFEGVTIEDPQTPMDQNPNLPSENKPNTTNPGTNIPDTKVPLDKLPQTGQLWWPVLALSVLGIFCLISGSVLRKRTV